MESAGSRGFILRNRLSIRAVVAACAFGWLIVPNIALGVCVNNGILDTAGGEQCDPVIDAADDCCDDTTCLFLANNAPCGSQSSNLCDRTDQCNATGVCQTRNRAAGFVCRAVAGACDVQETCPGGGVDCPADLFATTGECRPDAGDCDVAESCDGSGPNCPANGFDPDGTPCGDQTSTVCNRPDQCNANGGCQPRLRPATFECRPAAPGGCDVAENCDGAGNCPADLFATTGVCRPRAGVCDLPETCSGTAATCPPDGFATTGVCRPDAGDCDVAENCNGTGPNCPTDLFDPPGPPCRPAAGPCDAAEVCTGGGPNCPANQFAPAGTPCNTWTSEGVCDNPDTCSGGGVCLDNLDPAGTECRPTAAKCDPAEECTGSSPDCPPDATIPGCCVSDDDCPRDLSKCYDNFCNHLDPRDPFDNVCDTAFIPECRVSISKKGSLLYYSKIELRWTVTAGTPPTVTPRQDMFITIVNDFPDWVDVQWYFINGDEPLAAVFTGDPPTLSERAHKGWNSFNCTTCLSPDETTYYSAFTGGPLGCQPFTILDPGTLPGRPDPEHPGQRVLRGYAIAFAVEGGCGGNNSKLEDGAEISWNHLSGHTTIVNYADRSAWEYNAYAFQCVANVEHGSACESENNHDVAGIPSGILKMDGIQYDFAFDKLLFDFYAVGSLAFSLPPSTTVMLDTDLTLYPVSVDLRTTDTDSDGPVITRAKFDVWNQNEDAQSGVNRCITCWDQTLLSNYDAPNSFLIGNLQTNKGKARIDGIESDSCDAPGACCNVDDDPDCSLTDLERIENGGEYDRDCSEKASLLGVSDKILVFSGAATGRTDAGMTLVGQGIQQAVIKRELVEGPDPLTNGLQVPNADNATGIDDASSAPVRQSSSSNRRPRSDKNVP